MSQLDLRRGCEKQLKKVGRKYKRDTKLQELERQLEFAESRCGTLKQQLDYIKMLYRCGKTPHLEQSAIEEGHGDGAVINQLSSNDLSKWSCQNENFTSRGDPLSCKTSSRVSLSKPKVLPEDGDCPVLIKQNSHSNTTTTISSNKLFSQETRGTKTKSPKPKANLKLLKVKKKISKKVKKRRKLEDVPSSKVSNASSQTQSQIYQDPVVEIYKNMAVNAESESGLEILAKGKFNKPNEGFKSKPSIRQALELREEIKAKSFNCLTPEKEPDVREETPQNDFLPELNNLINKPIGIISNEPETVCLETLKSYCKPTISSKRKQVERDIYNLNIKSIPFVAARSTAPSHNIGVNIQQVLSIIKKRNPLSENLLNAGEIGSQEHPVATLISSRKLGCKTNETVSAPATGTASSESKKERPRTNLSHWKSNSEVSKTSATVSGKLEPGNTDWSLKVDKLKKVLVFLHEDFTSLSQKYKRLQKKLTKRNITKTDAKDELAYIERDLEKKEEEITVVIALYKEVLNLREEYKKLQEKYDMVASGRNSTVDGLKQSNSAHLQMTSLLRKIQSFQKKLSGW